MKTIVLATAAMVVLAMMLSAVPAPKITICHIPPGNPANAHAITISVNALPAHLAHGDPDPALPTVDGDPCSVLQPPCEEGECRPPLP
jgi:hypothetical protein